LPAVTREFADGLRQRIGGAKATPLADDELPAASLTPILQLDWRDMIRIGLADRRALIIFAVIGPLMDKMGDSIEPYFEKALQAVTFEVTQIGAMNSASIVAGIIIALIIVFTVLSIAAALLRYHNFKLFLDGHTLRSHGGLLTRHEHSMDLEKIQTLRLQQGIIQAWLKRYKMTARQAISGRKQQSGKVFTIPVVTDEQSDMLRPMLFAGEAGRLTQNPRSEHFQSVSPYYMRSRILFLGVLPALVFVALGIAGFSRAEWLAIPWLSVVGLLSWRSWKRAGYLHDDDEIVRRSGLFGFRTVGLLFRKVQRVTITQSRYQRRKNLASLRMHMASGSVRLPYIDHTDAQQLRDYILYRVESSQKPWH
jgi:putative membrane protein